MSEIGVFQASFLAKVLIERRRRTADKASSTKDILD
jgi:hypothetical protein